MAGAGARAADRQREIPLTKVERTSTGELVYVGVGANLGDAVANLRSGIAAVDELPSTSVLACSSLYRSAPVGPAGQPDYVNAVFAARTKLTPHALLDALKAIERAHGRVERERWGARELDLDILLYGGLYGDGQISDNDLQIPHPELAHRAFVLMPLQEIAPGLIVPGLGAIEALLDAVDAGPETLSKLS